MTYEEHRRTLIEYLKAKVELADWQGVSDAANDLRVLEAGRERHDEIRPRGNCCEHCGGSLDELLKRATGDVIAVVCPSCKRTTRV